MGKSNKEKPKVLQIKTVKKSTETNSNMSIRLKVCLELGFPKYSFLQIFTWNLVNKVASSTNVIALTFHEPFRQLLIWASHLAQCEHQTLQTYVFSFPSNLPLSRFSVLPHEEKWGIIQLVSFVWIRFFPDFCFY